MTKIVTMETEFLPHLWRRCPERAEGVSDAPTKTTSQIANIVTPSVSLALATSPASGGGILLEILKDEAVNYDRLIPIRIILEWAILTDTDIISLFFTQFRQGRADFIEM